MEIRELHTSTVKSFANEGVRYDLSFVPELSGQALGSVTGLQTIQYTPIFSSGSVKRVI